MNNLISSKDGKDKGKVVLKSGKPKGKQNKANINVGANISISGPSGETKPTPSTKDLTHSKGKKVELPAKILKMKDLISQPFKEPIHEVKEIPKFEIYKRK